MSEVDRKVTHVQRRVSVFVFDGQVWLFLQQHLNNLIQPSIGRHVQRCGTYTEQQQQQYKDYVTLVKR
jgi:hypothetical protein